MKKKIFGTLILLIALLVTACSNENDEEYEVPFDDTMGHIHGIGYAGSDDGLYFASHTGLKIYRDGKWFTTATNLNDYMGFAAVDKGFYASGHPGKNSKLPNPIGLQRSFDGGKTLDSIEFEGESDFHVMAVGYTSHDVILLNEQENSKLDVGIHFREDSNESWTALSASGLDGDILSFSIHPSNSKYIAAGTNHGVYLSKDKGDSFTLISAKEAVGTAVFFNEENLYYVSYDSHAKFEKYNIDTNEIEDMQLPELQDDAPIFITQNPNDTEQLAIYTIKGQAFVSGDYGEVWEQILIDNTVKK